MIEAVASRLVEQLPLVVLFGVITGALLVVVKGADILVDQAVSLSTRWGVPKMLIGATIVSIGTTLPEAAVSVFAAVQGNPGLALGNAVGSIIADTGLILGLAALIGAVPIEPRLVSRQSWIQVGSAVLIVVLALPLRHMSDIMTTGGRLPQWAGVFFLVLLVLYLWRSITWSRDDPTGSDASTDLIERGESIHSTLMILLELVLGIAMVVIGSRILIPAVEETAIRLRIPDAIIAATLVAFGTSLPELVTAVTAVRKGHGELAIGNVLGADVLNVLFVSGAAAAVTPGGLAVPPQFFYLFFPSMLFIIAVLRSGITYAGRQVHRSETAVGRPLAVLLLLTYSVTVILGYAI